MAILVGLLGSWGRKGGYYLPEKVELPAYPTPAYPKPKSSWQDLALPHFPLAGAPVTNVIMDNAHGEDALYKGLFVHDTNLPLTMPGIRPTLEAAARSLDVIVAVDVQPAEITGYADVVLPECSYLERYDPLRNNDEREPSIALRAPAIALRAPALPPRGESKPGWWTTKQIGERIGLGKYFPWKSYQEVVDWQLRQVGTSLAEMRKTGIKTFPRKTPAYYAPGQTPTFDTPSSKIELYSKTLEDAGFDALPRYTRPKAPPDGFYHLNYGRAPQHSFSRPQNNPVLYQLMPENLVWIHTTAARRFGIRNGGYVTLVNQDGGREQQGAGAGHRAHAACLRLARPRLRPYRTGAVPRPRDRRRRFGPDDARPLRPDHGRHRHARQFRDLPQGGRVMPHYAIVIDTRTCIGCTDCVDACRMENSVPEGLCYDWVVEITQGRYPELKTEFRSERCNHCSHATCVAACPTGASQYWNGSNIVVVDATVCTGCKACIAACPYDARLIMEPQGYIGKCTFSVHRVHYGEDPACVATCPAHAMHFGLLDDPTSTVSRLLAGINVALGVALGIYTGVQLSGFNARPFWHSAVLGPLFLVSGLSTGAAVIILGARTAEERARPRSGTCSGASISASSWWRWR